MRKFQTAISFLLIIAVTVVVVGLLYAGAVKKNAGRSSEPLTGQEIDATRNVLMCI